MVLTPDLTMLSTSLKIELFPYLNIPGMDSISSVPSMSSLINTGWIKSSDDNLFSETRSNILELDLSLLSLVFGNFLFINIGLVCYCSKASGFYTFSKF